MEEESDIHLIQKIKPPKPEIRAIKPYTPEELQRMFSVLHRSQEFNIPGKCPFIIAKPNPLRNYASQK